VLGKGVYQVCAWLKKKVVVIIELLRLSSIHIVNLPDRTARPLHRQKHCNPQNVVAISRWLCESSHISSPQLARHPRSPKYILVAHKRPAATERSPEPAPQAEAEQRCVVAKTPLAPLCLFAFSLCDSFLALHIFLVPRSFVRVRFASRPRSHQLRRH